MVVESILCNRKWKNGTEFPQGQRAVIKRLLARNSTIQMSLRISGWLDAQSQNGSLVINANPIHSAKFAHHELARTYEFGA
jgi:hypothetical protein